MLRGDRNMSERLLAAVNVIWATLLSKQMWTNTHQTNFCFRNFLLFKKKRKETFCKRSFAKCPKCAKPDNEKRAAAGKL